MAKSRRANQEVLDALSDVITVSPTPEKSSFPAGQDSVSAASYSGQAPMTTFEPAPSVPTKDHFDPLGPGAARARNKEATAPQPPAKGMGKFANAFRRQTNEEKEAKRKEKEKRMNKAIDDSTMKSSRMDIIDRLDLSGIHGSSLFHHDSPYDACSPHSNRNSRRAPVMAFDHTIDPLTGQPIGMRAQNGGASSNNRPGLSPLAAATMRKMDNSAADVHEDSKRGLSQSSASTGGRSRTMPNGQIPTLRMDSNSSTTSTNLLSPAEGNEADQVSMASHSTMDRDVDAERAYRNNNYYNAPSNVSKGRTDMANPNADIWGVSSEPWQDFADGLKPNNGGNTNQRHSVESGGSGNASAASSVFDMEAVMTGKPASSRLAKENGGLSPTVEKGAEGTGPKRSKSLIKKIKSARQNPNVPPPPDDELELGNLSIGSDTRARSTSASSVPRRGQYHHGHSPSTPPLMSQQSPQLDSAPLGRSGTLRAGQSNGYYRKDLAGSTAAPSGDGAATGPTSPPLTRNGSIFGRFRGGKNRERGEVAAAR